MRAYASRVRTSPTNTAPKPAPTMPKIVVPYLSQGMGVTAGPGGIPKMAPNAAQQYPSVPTNAPAPGTPPKAPIKPIDYSGDPWLQRFLAGFTTGNQEDEATALSDQKALLLGFGSKELAQKLLGNDPFVNTISDDPKSSFSVLANMRRAYDQTQAQMNDQYNKANLWFGGKRGQALGDLATSYMGDVNEATQTIMGRFNEIRDRLVAAKRNRTAERERQEFAAWERARDEALASGAAPPDGGGSSVDGGGGSAPGGTPTATPSAPAPAPVAPPVSPLAGLDPWMAAYIRNNKRPSGSGSGSVKAL